MDWSGVELPFLCPLKRCPTNWTRTSHRQGKEEEQVVLNSGQRLTCAQVDWSMDCSSVKATQSTWSWRQTELCISTKIPPPTKEIQIHQITQGKIECRDTLPTCTFLYSVLLCITESTWRETKRPCTKIPPLDSDSVVPFSCTIQQMLLSFCISNDENMPSPSCFSLNFRKIECRDTLPTCTFLYFHAISLLICSNYFHDSFVVSCAAAAAKIDRGQGIHPGGMGPARHRLHDTHGFLSAMGDYTIRISTSLIEQLARDDEKQVKRRTRKPKPKKVVEQPEESQDNGRELPTEPKSSPAPVLPFPPPMYLPVTPAPPPPPPVIQEVEAIHAVVAESEKVLEKLQKKEATMREELTKRAKELHDKEFKLPYQNPSPCTDERAGCAECYRSNVQDPLKCAEAVKRFEACVRMARRSGGAMGAAQ